MLYVFKFHSNGRIYNLVNCTRRQRFEQQESGRSACLPSEAGNSLYQICKTHWTKEATLAILTTTPPDIFSLSVAYAKDITKLVLGRVPARMITLSLAS